MKGNDDRSGIDVSRWQGKIDWQTVQNRSIDFALAKATEGATWQDPLFKENWQGMKRQGIEAGAYHVFRGTSTPQDQADNILTVLKPVGFNHSTDRFALSIVRDDKLTPTEFANRIGELIGNLSALLVKERVMIYTSPDWWNGRINYHAYDFSKQPLWVAHWTTAKQPRLPGNWSTWSIWHYTNKGKVAGIQGNVNLDRMPPLPALVEPSLGNLSRGIAEVQDALPVENTTAAPPHAAADNTGCPLLESGWRLANWVASFFQSTPGSQTTAVQSTLQNELSLGKDLRLAADAMNNGSAQRVLIQQMSYPVSPHNASVTAAVGGSPFVNTTLHLPLVAG